MSAKPENQQQAAVSLEVYTGQSGTQPPAYEVKTGRWIHDFCGCEFTHCLLAYFCPCYVEYHIGRGINKRTTGKVLAGLTIGTIVAAVSIVLCYTIGVFLVADSVGNMEVDYYEDDYDYDNVAEFFAAEFGIGMLLLCVLSIMGFAVKVLLILRCFVHGMLRQKVRHVMQFREGEDDCEICCDIAAVCLCYSCSLCQEYATTQEVVDEGTYHHLERV